MILSDWFPNFVALIYLFHMISVPPSIPIHWRGGAERGGGCVKNKQTNKQFFGGADGGSGGGNAISPFFDASKNKNIGATVRIGQEIRCLPYAEFF